MGEYTKKISDDIGFATNRLGPLYLPLYPCSDASHHALAGTRGSFLHWENYSWHRTPAQWVVNARWNRSDFWMHWCMVFKPLSRSEFRPPRAVSRLDLDPNRGSTTRQLRRNESNIWWVDRHARTGANTVILLVKSLGILEITSSGPIGLQYSLLTGRTTR